MITIKNAELGHFDFDRYSVNRQKWEIGPKRGPLNYERYSIKIDFQNDFDKIIKYITFFVVPFDRVNEPINCSFQYGGSQTARLKYTGPIDKNELIEDAIWENVVDNDTLEDVFIRKIDIIFMDNSKETIYISKFVSEY